MDICKTCRNKIKRGKYCSNNCYFENKKQLMQQSEINPNSKLTVDKVKEIIELYKNGLSQNKISKIYGVSSPCISDIITGKSWQLVEKPVLITGRLKDVLSKYPELTIEQKEVINGSLLGDGFIINNHQGNCHFAKKQKIENIEYIQWLHKVLKPYSRKKITVEKSPKIKNTKNKITRSWKWGYLESCVMRTSCHPVFTELRNSWYIKQKKIVPHTLKLTPLILAIWFCDDGYLAKDRTKATIATDSFSLEDNYFLQNLLIDEFKIESKIYINRNYSNPLPRIHINKASIDKLTNVINEHITCQCFNYKKAK